MRVFKPYRFSLVPFALLAPCLLALTACGGDSSSASQSRGLAVAANAADSNSAWTGLGTRASSSQSNPVLSNSNGAKWQSYDRPEEYPGFVNQANQLLQMDDGTDISFTVTRPADASGQAVKAALPTIVTYTPYNKNVGEQTNALGGITPLWVKRGYNQVFVDVRGTGRSHGSWDPFSEREQADYTQVMDWIVKQPWSNGILGLHGISATATTSLLAANKGHPAVKAVFPIVPHGDVYRDLVFVGGQASLGFLPIWMSVVTGLGVLNPSFYQDPQQQFTASGEHLVGLKDFVIPRTAGVLTEEEGTAYDNAYWATKSPLEFAKKVMVPTFIVGGLFDIFQRSEALNYESLKNHTTAKLLIGPWHHLEASTGAGLPRDGIPTLEAIALMWFDRYLKGMENGAENLPNVTQWVWGDEKYQVSDDWPHPQAQAMRLHLRADKTLTQQTEKEGAGQSMVVQQPLNGICSQSTLQISIGLVGYVPLPCWKEDNTTQNFEAVFDSPPLEEDLYINGPIQADIWMSTTASNAGLVVRVSDLQSDGTARALSSGLQTASLRAVDESRSRYLNGEMIQPWHPFTKASQQILKAGEPVKVPVEIFPTSALIKKGNRLRISVGPSNFPFGAMPLPTLAQSALGVISIYHDSKHQSSVVLPTVPARVLKR